MKKKVKEERNKEKEREKERGKKTEREREKETKREKEGKVVADTQLVAVERHRSTVSRVAQPTVGWNGMVWVIYNTCKTSRSSSQQYRNRAESTTNKIDS